MLRRLLFLEESRVLTEQLRLVLGNVGMSVLPTIVLSCVLVWVLQTDDNATALGVWAAAVNASKLINAHHARRVLATGICSEGAHALAP